MALKDQLPSFYKNLISSQIFNFKIEETKATCSNCLRARDQRFLYNYKENLKCCTFVPFIPNYFVGAILKNNLAGSTIINKKINENRFAIPMGIFPDFQYQYTFLNKKKTDFGRKEELLCHYYDTEKNQCSIWQYRGVVCTTFFCRSDFGRKGEVFWQSLKDYLSYVEIALAEECLVMTDFSPRDISDQLEYLNKRDFVDAEKNKLFLSKSEVKKLWNGYTDKQAYYISCYEYVLKLKRKEFSIILGEQGRNLELNVLSKRPSVF